MFKMISLFAGVGGIDLGFEQTGHFETIFANEFDKYAQKTYSNNFNVDLDPSDIQKIDYSELPNADIVLAGFPCQPFSVAGYQKGFEDERGNLFFDTLKVIQAVKPQVVFLENVKNLQSHDNGNTFKVIVEALQKNGYHVRSAVLNAKDVGNIPQNRERIYIVGFKNKKYLSNFEFPGNIPLTTTLSDIIDFNSIVDEKYYYRKDKQPFYDLLESAVTSQDSIYQWRRRYVRENKSGVVPTLTANMGTGGHNVPIIKSEHGIRKLTPRETFNAQGFPKDYKLPTDMSNTQLYKQAGNSVVVPVIKRIAESVYDSLMSNPTNKIRYEQVELPVMSR